MSKRQIKKLRRQVEELSVKLDSLRVVLGQEIAESSRRRELTEVARRALRAAVRAEVADECDLQARENVARALRSIADTCRGATGERVNVADYLDRVVREVLGRPAAERTMIHTKRTRER